jgi:diacylglycerol kinase (ATP)
MQIPTPSTGVKRVFRAFKFSYQGFIHGIKDEAAFRQEFFFTLITIPLAAIWVSEVWLKIALIVAPIFIMIVELLNSAIEAVVDIAAPEYHKLAKVAKDMGSLAVLFSFLIWLILATTALCLEFC